MRAEDIDLNRAFLVVLDRRDAAPLEKRVESRNGEAVDDDAEQDEPVDHRNHDTSKQILFDCQRLARLGK